MWPSWFVAVMDLAVIVLRVAVMDLFLGRFQESRCVCRQRNCSTVLVRPVLVIDRINTGTIHRALLIKSLLKLYNYTQRHSSKCTSEFSQFVHYTVLYTEVYYSIYYSSIVQYSVQSVKILKYICYCVFECSCRISEVI